MQMKKNAVVLGCGMVGATMARDLASDPDFDVTVADVSEENLRRLASSARVKIVAADLSDPDRISNLVSDFDIVLGAMPSHFGFATLRAVIQSGKPYCDISFMPENALELDALARQRRATAVVDCGVSPGLSNMAVGFAQTKLDRIDDAVIYVGGLPKVRSWPYQYKAPFAPADVLEEYTRPARFIEHGRMVVRPALSESELIEFSRAGTLEAFNTDGLRSLLHTAPASNMKEKTLRYPGHIELMRVLRETGFFSKEPISVKGVEIRPLDVASRLLFPKWRYEQGEEEFTILRVLVSGPKGGDYRRLTFDLFDEYDVNTAQSSMARTTAFPCTIVARMIASGRVPFIGVLPPEVLARTDGVLDHVTSELRRRGVEFSLKEESITKPN